MKYFKRNLFGAVLLSLLTPTVLAAQSTKGSSNAASIPTKANVAEANAFIQSDHSHDPIDGPSTLPTTGLDYLPIDLDVPGQSFVSSGPYIGIPLEYSGSNLIINTPSVNQDVALLKIRKNINTRLKAMGIKRDPNHAHILLSGIVEGQASYRSPYTGSGRSNIDLTSAGLDAYILGPSDWLSSLISLSYDNTPGAIEGSLNNYARTQNSRVYVNQAFITFGDFLQSPIYGTLGQYFVPFGTYSSNMISSPITKTMARTKARAILVGVQPQVPHTFYGSAFIFRGDTHVGSTASINNGGINVGYRSGYDPFNIVSDVGMGVIANIADSVGMQNNGMPQGFFGGFGGSDTTNSGFGNEQITHRVPAYDFRALLSLKDHVDILAEYIVASTSFNRNDLMMNTHGARPQALNVEAAYTFSGFPMPASVAVGYGMSKDALALTLPAQRYSLVFNASWWKDTLQSLEFRHDVDYSASSTGNGSNATGVNAPIQGTGKGANMVTAQFDIYF